MTSNLPDPNDPYVTSTGIVVVNDDDGQIDRVSVEEYNARQKVLPFPKFMPSFEMTQDTMPEADVQNQIAIAAVVGLRMMGLPVSDIAEMFKTSIDNISRMVEKPSTQKTFERIFQGIVSGNSTALQGRIAHFGNNAVAVVAELMNNDETRDDVRLKAAQDVLDRAGTNADQFFAKDKDSSNAQDDELRIVMMDETGEKEKVTVELKRGK